MNLMLLSAILAWSVFWLGYAIYSYNAESFYYRYRKRCTKKEKPLLFHTEIFVSLFWSFLGYLVLFVFFTQNI